MSIAELARRLKRDYKNVYGDVEKLIEWRAVEKDEKGRVVAPYSEVILRLWPPGDGGLIFYPAKSTPKSVLFPPLDRIILIFPLIFALCRFTSNRMEKVWKMHG